MTDAPRTPGQVAEAVLRDADQRSRLIHYAGSRFGIPIVDAEDLLQETALGLLRQRGYVRDPAGFVFAAFRSRCAVFAQVRRRSRERFRPGEEADGSIPSPIGTDRIDRRIALREALRGVSSACRRLLCAYYMEGLTLNEAAEGMTLTYGVVSRRISRCLERLRACLN